MGWRSSAFFFVFCGAIFPQDLHAESAQQRKVIFYGMLADEPVFDSRTKNFRAKGNIALLTSEGFLTGELLASQNGGQVVTIEGGVTIVRKSEKVTASRAVIDRQSGEFLIYDAEIIADPLMNAKEAVDANLLGVSVEEVAFERARQDRIVNLEKELRSLRDSYVRARNLEVLSRERDSFLLGSMTIQKKYAAVLRDLTIVRNAPNEVFDELPEDVKKRFADRRAASAEFLAAHPEFLATNQALSGVSGYARIKADKIYRDENGIYTYTRASVTPCRCAPEKAPIFGLSSATGSIEVGGYAHMRGAMLDVFNVPVLYSPYFIYPVKRSRESGFLQPKFFLSQNDRVVGIPYFQTLGEHADATIAVNDFAKRGTRIDLEARFQLSPESKMEAYGEFVNDKRFKEQNVESQQQLRAKIDSLKGSGSANALEIEDLSDRVVAPTSKRWYLRGGWSVPVTGWAAAKVNGEVVSDPRYFSDFSNDDDSTPGLNLLKPSPTSKRFLTHEAAVEYYGSDSVMSLRSQGVRDIFSLRSTDTIYRVPRLELAWLPRTYFGLPVSVDAFASWERVRRNSRGAFVDLVRSTETSRGFVQAFRDGARESDEPYVSGDRSFGKVNLLLPLPTNKYVSASLGASAAGNEYRFPAVSGDVAHSAAENYVTYNADVSMPLFSEFSIFSRKERTLQGTLRHDFVPSVNFTVIPDVWRSARYPLENQLFYAHDAVYPVKEIAVGFRSTWSLSREGFANSGEVVKRIPESIDPGVGIEKVLERVIVSKSFKIDSTAAARFRFATSRESAGVLEQWASEELSGYYAAVRQVEFGNDYLWTDAETFRRVQKWKMVPFSFGVSSAYNLDAARTEREKRQRNNIQEGVSLAKVPSWGDLQVSATASSDPLLPLSVGYAGTWSVFWNRWTKHSGSLGGNINNIYSASTSYSEIITPSDTISTVDKAWGYALGYAPRSWISFTHSWSKLQKRVGGNLVRDAAYNDPAFDTSNIQVVTLVGMQDCMDITFKRQKDFKQREMQAVWSIGINMNIFGQKAGPIEVGQPLNSFMQSNK